MSDSQPLDEGMGRFYERYYEATATSRANALYCEQLFGRNFAQHGFAEMSHLNHLIQVTNLGPRSRVLDIGCGNGGIAAYVAERTGAHVTGIDLNAEAIRQAQERATALPGRLAFHVMNLVRPTFPPAWFDTVLAVDTLYFAPLTAILPGLLDVLTADGQLAAFWSQSCEPPQSLEEFDRNTVQVDRTELAVALRQHGLGYEAWDYTRADYEHARRKRQIAEALRAQFEAEGNSFLYENHRDEAAGVIRAFEGNAHGRYLYRAWRA